MDLGANEYVTFYRITLPLIAPGILAGALLAFSLSIDDFVITSFNSGTTTTFPLFVWSAAQRGVPPEVNVIGTMIFGVAILLMLANVLWQYRRDAERSCMSFPATTSPPTSCRKPRATTSGCTSRACRATRTPRCRSSCAATAATSRTSTASATSTRSPGSSRSTSATASARRSGEAAAAQMRELPFYTNWTYAHPRAIELAAEVASVAPGDLNRVFFVLGRLRGGRVGLEARAPVPRRPRRAPLEGDRAPDRLPRDDDGRALDQRHRRAEDALRAARPGRRSTSTTRTATTGRPRRPRPSSPPSCSTTSSRRSSRPAPRPSRW